MTRATILRCPDWQSQVSSIHPTLLLGLTRLRSWGKKLQAYRAMKPHEFLASSMTYLTESGGLNWKDYPADMEHHLRCLMIGRLENLQFDAAKAFADIVNAGNDESLREVEVEDVLNYSAWILTCKNRDYGSSVYSPGAFTPYLEQTGAALVRLGDKFQRLKTLSQQDASVNESIADTVLDVIGYCTILIGMNLAEYPSNQPQEKDNPLLNLTV